MKERGIFLGATEIFVSAPGKDRLVRAMRIGVSICYFSQVREIMTRSAPVKYEPSPRFVGL